MKVAAKGLKEAQEKLSIMKLPEDEQKAYEHFKDDLNYQASMFEFSFGDGYKEGEAKTTQFRMLLNMTKNGIPVQTIIKVTGLIEEMPFFRQSDEK